MEVTSISAGPQSRSSIVRPGALVVWLSLWFIPACATGQNGGDKPIQLGLGEAVEVEGLKLSFEKLLSDSRCPVNVTCVWQGTVEVEVHVSDPSGNERSLIIDLVRANPADLGDGKSLRLVTVTPGPRKVSAAPDTLAYRITLLLEDTEPPK
jgi:hypothetical protein